VVEGSRHRGRCGFPGKEAYLGYGCRYRQPCKTQNNVSVYDQVEIEDVPDFALVVGVPAQQVGWMSKHGLGLQFDESGRATCEATGEEYVLENGVCKEAD